VSRKNRFCTNKWPGFDEIVAIHFHSTLFAAVTWVVVQTFGPQNAELSDAYIYFSI